MEDSRLSENYSGAVDLDDKSDPIYFHNFREDTEEFGDEGFSEDHYDRIPVFIESDREGSTHEVEPQQTVSVQESGNSNFANSFEITDLDSNGERTGSSEDLTNDDGHDNDEQGQVYFLRRLALEL